MYMLLFKTVEMKRISISERLYLFDIEKDIFYTKNIFNDEK